MKIINSNHEKKQGIRKSGTMFRFCQSNYNFKISTYFVYALHTFDKFLYLEDKQLYGYYDYRRVKSQTDEVARGQ